MSSGIIDVIKEVSINAAEADCPVKILYGKVLSVDPIKVKIGEELILEKDFLRVNGTVNTDEDVVVIRQQGGQKYIVLGSTTDTLVDTIYVGGEDGEGNGYRFPLNSPWRTTSPYGYRIHPISHTRKFHTGVDLVANNKNIFAISSGKVIKSSYSTGWGNEVRIKHADGYVSQYAHLNKKFVKVGDVVKCGAVIGIMGKTGATTGVHLHFGIQKGNDWNNPTNYLKKRGVKC